MIFKNLASKITRMRIATAIIFVLGSTQPVLAVSYDFLTVATTGTNSSEFTSLHGNGVIDVSDTFSAGGAAALENANTAIFPSQFLTLFPGTGQVQGHLFQENVNSTSTATFDLTGYNLSTSTVFGVWNMTDEASGLYTLQLVDASNNVTSPTSFNLIGNQDNETQVAGKHRLVLDTSTGKFNVGALINASGTHTDAVFFDNIPAGTKKIIVSGSLPNLTTGDGVGYYFAELVPEPSSLVVSVLAPLMLGIFARKRTR